MPGLDFSKPSTEFINPGLNSKWHQCTITVDDEVSTTPSSLVPAAAGRPDIVKQVTGAARTANALAQVAEDMMEGGLQGVVTSRPYTVTVLAEAA